MPVSDIRFGPKQRNEFVTIERRELGRITERIANELAPTVESAPLPCLIDLVEK
jgi:hypothetical protein